MYTYVDGNLAISVNDWCEAGLTYRQFRQDSQTGYLKIARRGINGNTLILLDSIRRPDRLRKIEEAFGKARVEKGDIFELSIDTKAREFFSRCVKPDGSPLPDRLQHLGGVAVLSGTAVDGHDLHSFPLRKVGFPRCPSIIAEGRTVGKPRPGGRRKADRSEKIGASESGGAGQIPIAAAGGSTTPIF